MAHLPRLLCSLGMTPWDCPTSGPVASCYTVTLDGRVIGNVEQEIAEDLVKRLRIMKAQQLEKVSDQSSQFGIIYIIWHIHR